MDRGQVDAWSREIFVHCTLGQWAWRNLRRQVRTRVIEGFRPTGGASPMNIQAILLHLAKTWGSVWLMVSSGATISRILWPGESKLKKFAQELRDELDLPATPEIRARGVRDSLEHVENSARGWQRRLFRRLGRVQIAAWAVGDGSTGFTGPTGVPPEQCFRYLNGLTWDLRVGTFTCNLKALAVDFETLAGSIRVDQHMVITLPK